MWWIWYIILIIGIALFFTRRADYPAKWIGIVTMILYAFYPETIGWWVPIVIIVFSSLAAVFCVLSPVELGELMAGALSGISETSGLLAASLGLIGLTSKIRRESLGSRLIALVIVTIVTLITLFSIPSPNYYKTLILRVQPYVIHLIFIFTFFLSFYLASLTFPSILAIILFPFLFLFFLAPYTILYLTTVKCMETISVFGHTFSIPTLAQLTRGYSCERLTTVSLEKTGKVYTIPSLSGIKLEIGMGEMNPLPAGGSYKEAIFLRNNYAENVSLLKIQPILKSKYFNTFFIPTDYQQSKTNLLPGEVYGEEIKFDPHHLEMETSAPICKVPREDMEKAGITGECDANTLACPSPFGYQTACVETSRTYCECIDWVKATCSGAPLTLYLLVTHTGFLTGKGILYYFEKYMQTSLPAYKYSQPPAEATFKFIPNPWFQERYGKYINEVFLFAQIKVGGRNPQLTSLEVEPRDIVINITDLYKNISITETVGIVKKDCNLKEKLKEINEVLKSRGHWSGILCTFTPPSVHVKIVNLTNNEVLLDEPISLLLLNEYCNTSYEAFKYSMEFISNVSQNKTENENVAKNESEEVPSHEEPSPEESEEVLEEKLLSKGGIITEMEIYKKYWNYLRVINSLPESTRKSIKEHNICSYLRENIPKEKKGGKEAIEENLRRVAVWIRFDYITTSVKASRSISPYYTSFCESLAKKAELKTEKVEEEKLPEGELPEGL
jgi:hypothetical protein